MYVKLLAYYFKLKKLDEISISDNLSPIDRGVDSQSRNSRQSLRQDIWVMTMHSLSKGRKWESKKSRNRLRLDNSVSRVTSTCACTRSFAYIRDILFSRVYYYEEGACTAFVLHLSSFSLLSSSAFAFTLPGLRVRSSTSGRYCVTMHTTGQTPMALRATDSGANVIIFRNLLSRCSLLWSRRRRRCRSVARGLFSRLVSDSRRHCDILPPFVQWNEFFCARIRAIVKSSYPCTDTNMREKKKER